MRQHLSISKIGFLLVGKKQTKNKTFRRNPKKILSFSV
jgi:hypothetical protein